MFKVLTLQGVSQLYKGHEKTCLQGFRPGLTQNLTMATEDS